MSSEDFVKFNKDVDKAVSKREEIKENNKATLKEFYSRKLEKEKKELYDKSLESINKLEPLTEQDLPWKEDRRMKKFYFDNKIAVIINGYQDFWRILHIVAKKNGSLVSRNYDERLDFHKKCDELKKYRDPNAFSNHEKYPGYNIDFTDLVLNNEGNLEINFDVELSDTGEKFLSYKKIIDPKNF